MSEGGSTLEYAAAPPRGWRRWRRWGLVACLVFAVGTVLAYREPILRRGRVLYWQQRCLTYTRPPGTPVVTTQPSAGGDADFVRVNGTAYRMSPECWRQLESARWAGFRVSRTLGLVGFERGTVFLHERVSPQGHRRLVHVESIYDNALQPDTGFHVALVAPGSPWRDPADVGPRFGFAASGRFIVAKRFFGQPDPNDPSHFTIDYAAEGELRGTIDGWLRDDDTVDFKLRDAASTRGL